MGKQEFPKWVYFRTPEGKTESKLIDGPADMKKDYVESPADLPEVETGPTDDAAPVEVPVVPAVSAAAKALAAEAEAELAAFYKAPATIVASKVRKMESLTDLQELRDLEENRPGGGRPSVLKALAEQLAAVVPSDPADAPSAD